MPLAHVGARTDSTTSYSYNVRRGQLPRTRIGIVRRTRARQAVCAEGLHFSAFHSYLGCVSVAVQVVPGGIESVNGSAVDMGCTSPLADSGGMMVCGGGSRSFLVDGCIPDIDTNTSDWASQLVTVRRNEESINTALDFPHVLLTFAFDTAVSLTQIEMDLFNCTDWNIGAPIGAPSMVVFLNSDHNLVYHRNLQFVSPDNSPQSSCDSLSTVTFTGHPLQTGSYHTFHILVDLSNHASIEWVHVGEVRFIGVLEPGEYVYLVY